MATALKYRCGGVGDIDWAQKGAAGGVGELWRFAEAGVAGFAMEVEARRGEARFGKRALQEEWAAAWLAEW